MAVKQLRVVVEAEDYEEAVRFFRDTLGMPEELAVAGDGEARVIILQAGRATLEIAKSGTETDDRRGGGGAPGRATHPHAVAIAELAP